MSGQARLVVDASVAAKWYLTDEAPDETELARELSVACAAGRIEVLAPDFLRMELTAALSRGFHRGLRGRGGHVTAERDLAVLLDTMFAAPIQFSETTVDQLCTCAVMALRFSRSVYDMIYLQLAEELDCQWCTADEKVLAPTRADFPRDRILLLRDLPTSKILA